MTDDLGGIPVEPTLRPEYKLQQACPHCGQPVWAIGEWKQEEGEWYWSQRPIRRLKDYDPHSPHWHARAIDVPDARGGTKQITKWACDIAFVCDTHGALPVSAVVDFAGEMPERCYMPQEEPGYWQRIGNEALAKARGASFMDTCRIMREALEAHGVTLR